jgi:hypothetical protein
MEETVPGVGTTNRLFVTTQAGLEGNSSNLCINHSRVESEQVNDINPYNDTAPSQVQLGQIRDTNDDDFRCLLESFYPDMQGQGLAPPTRNCNIPQTVTTGHFNNSTVVSNDTSVSQTYTNTATSRPTPAMALTHNSLVNQPVARQPLTAIPSFLFMLSTPLASTVYNELDISTVREAWGIVQHLGAPSFDVLLTLRNWNARMLWTI